MTTQPELIKPQGIFYCAERGTQSPLANKAWRATDQYRAPLAGEWYLRIGARLQQAWRAHEDLDQPFWIAEEVEAGGAGDLTPLAGGPNQPKIPV